MSENIAICPDCGETFETTGQEIDLPLQALRKSCSGCGYEVDITIIHYTNTWYEVVAPALRGDTCDARVPDPDRSYGTVSCGSDAMIRKQRLGEKLEARCAKHMGSFRETAMSFRSNL